MAPAKEYAPSSVMRVLVVEDSVPVAQLLDEGLSAEGHTVDVAETLEGARAALREGIPDILVLDRMLPDGDGLELVDELRAAGNDVPVILLTAIADVDSRVKGLKSGADDYLTNCSCAWTGCFIGAPPPGGWWWALSVSILRATGSGSATTGSPSRPRSSPSC
jgi:CheY-like chemotaxis protein